MTIIKRLAFAVAASALLATPTLAAAAPRNPATSLSVAKTARTGTQAPRSSKIAEGSNATLINVGILAVLVVGVLLLVDSGGDDDDSADSN